MPQASKSSDIQFNNAWFLYNVSSDLAADTIVANIVIYLCTEFDVCLILLSAKHEPP